MTYKPPDSSGVYKITCVINGKIYIGATADLRIRWGIHQSDLRRNNHGNLHLQNDWNQYGADAFTFEVLEFCPREVLAEREQAFFDILKPFQERGFNVRKIATVPKGSQQMPCQKPRTIAINIDQSRWDRLKDFQAKYWVKHHTQIRLRDIIEAAIDHLTAEMLDKSPDQSK